MPTKRKTTSEKKADLTALEVDYRTGRFTLRELEEKHPFSRSRISQLVQEHGWEQDLSARIAVKTKAKLQTALVRVEKQEAQTLSALDRAREKAIDGRVETMATLQAQLIAGHQTDISKYQGMCNSFLDELHMQGLCDGDLARIGELIAMIETQGDQQPDPAALQKRLNAFYKLLGLGERADIFKKLVEAKTKLVILERLAYGVQTDFTPAPPSNPSTPSQRSVESVALENLLKNLS